MKTIFVSIKIIKVKKKTKKSKILTEFYRRRLDTIIFTSHFGVYFFFLNFSFPLLAMIFGNKKESACILCGAVESKKTILKKCKTPDCPGKYCLNCYSKLENICTICQHPIDYGDITDISEEM